LARAVAGKRCRDRGGWLAPCQDSAQTVGGAPLPRHPQPEAFPPSCVRLAVGGLTTQSVPRAYSDPRVAHALLKHCVGCMIARMAWRFAWIVLPALLGVWLLGCGLDLSYLNCASKCEDVSAPVTASGSSGGSGVDAASNGSDAEMTGADMTIASEASDDVSAVDLSDTGSVDSGGTGGDAANDAGCFLCGTMACCLSRYQVCADGG